MPRSANPFERLFDDSVVVKKIKDKLPRLFVLAELESSRNGKVGMQVGSVREQILTALLVSVYGENNVNTEIPITEPEKDVEVLGNPLSIKTITGWGGIKVIWTVDAQKVREFAASYKPSCDILLAVIAWNQPESEGGLFLIPREVQETALRKIGRDAYLNLPKQGTNPRGVELSRDTVTMITSDSHTRRLGVDWVKEQVDYKPYVRWLDEWDDDK